MGSHSEIVVGIEVIRERYSSAQFENFFILLIRPSATSEVTDVSQSQYRLINTISTISRALKSFFQSTHVSSVFSGPAHAKNLHVLPYSLLSAPAEGSYGQTLPTAYCWKHRGTTILPWTGHCVLQHWEYTIVRASRGLVLDIFSPRDSPWKIVCCKGYERKSQPNNVVDAKLNPFTPKFKTYILHISDIVRIGNIVPYAIQRIGRIGTSHLKRYEKPSSAWCYISGEASRGNLYLITLEWPATEIGARPHAAVCPVLRPARKP